MEDLHKTVEEAKEAVGVLRKTVLDLTIESVQTMSEFGASEAEQTEKTNARKTTDDWTIDLIKFDTKHWRRKNSDGMRSGGRLWR